MADSPLRITDTNMNNLSTNIFVTFMITTFLVGYDVAHTQKIEVKAQEPTPVVTPSPTPETPESYIEKKWGEDSWKAFLLLKGRGKGTCAENRNLDQKALNRNWTKTEGVYWSTDFGIFQINDKFHPVKELNLDTDWRANIDYAYTLYERNGNFKLWTCGRKYNI